MKLPRETLLEEYHNFTDDPGNKTAAAEYIIKKYGLDKTPNSIRKRIFRALEEDHPKINNSPTLHSGANILFMDVETFPMEGYFWHPRQEDIPRSMIKKEGFMLCHSYKWHTDPRVYNDSIPRHRKLTKREPEYTPQDDREITASMLKLLDRADVVCGHNVDRFDRRVIQTHAIKHGFRPPSPYTTIDTLKVARKEFKFSSNRLDQLGEFLKCGRKIQTGGFDLWRGCLRGDKESWDKMIRYNDQDVLLVEEVYYKLLPWIRNHPNLAIHDEHEGKVCTKCGSEDIHFTTKQKATKVGLYNLFYCGNCFSWGAARENSLDKEQRTFLTKQA